MVGFLGSPGLGQINSLGNEDGISPVWERKELDVHLLSESNAEI